MGEQTDAELRSRKGKRDSDGGLGDLPGWLRAILLYVGLPVLVLLLAVGAIAGAKAWRRRRRRTAQRVSTRVIGAWHELVDHARDLGQQVPMGRGRTRREQAARLSSPEAQPLAERADALVFGPLAPETADADAFWVAVDEERASMSLAVDRRHRLAALVNLTTFRRRPRPASQRSSRVLVRRLSD